MDEFYNSDDPQAYNQFNALLADFYQKNKRPMSWRDEISPYRVVVSELMLQQTQVPRVMQKFPEFINIFPDFSTLAHASLEEVFRAWQGLGYNRRAKYLRQIAQEVITRWNGIVPDDPVVLQTLPGIGVATAGSIVAFAYNLPVVFIETNIRRVFIHHFFQNLTRPENRNLFRRDLNDFLGILGITSLTRCPIPNLKGSETYKLHLIAPGKSLFDGRENCVYALTGIFLTATGRFGNFIYQITFGHTKHLLKIWDKTL